MIIFIQNYYIYVNIVVLVVEKIKDKIQTLNEVQLTRQQSLRSSQGEDWILAKDYRY